MSFVTTKDGTQIYYSILYKDLGGGPFFGFNRPGA